MSMRALYSGRAPACRGGGKRLRAGWSAAGAAALLLCALFAGCGPELGDDPPRTRERNSRKEVIRLVIRLPGDDFGSGADIDLRRKIEAVVQDQGVGTIVRAGTGMGMMDIYIAVDDQAKARAHLKAVLLRAAPQLNYSLEPVVGIGP